MVALSETLELACQQIRAGQWDQARDLCCQVLKTDPHHSVAFHLLGIISHQTGKADIATDLICRAIDQNPHVPEYYVSLIHI